METRNALAAKFMASTSVSVRGYNAERIAHQIITGYLEAGQPLSDMRILSAIGTPSSLDIRTGQYVGQEEGFRREADAIRSAWETACQ